MASGTTVEKDVAETIDDFQEELKKLETDIDTYEKYKKSPNKVKEFYIKVYDMNSTLCTKLKEYAANYAELIMSSDKSNDDKYDDLDDFYDRILEDAYEEWSDCRSEIYEFWSDVRSALWDDDTEKVEKIINEFKEDIEKSTAENK